jgi:predicted secreted hydrolase
VYPSGWRIRVPRLGLDVTVTPRMEDQEMVGAGAEGIDYWEGSVAVRGSAGPTSREITGLGYVELTGYAGPVLGLQPEVPEDSGP